MIFFSFILSEYLVDYETNRIKFSNSIKGSPSKKIVVRSPPLLAAFKTRIMIHRNILRHVFTYLKDIQMNVFIHISMLHFIIQINSIIYKFFPRIFGL